MGKSKGSEGSTGWLPYKWGEWQGEVNTNGGAEEARAFDMSAVDPNLTIKQVVGVLHAAGAVLGEPRLVDKQTGEVYSPEGPSGQG